jgi:hypothetical protein
VWALAVTPPCDQDPTDVGASEGVGQRWGREERSVNPAEPC